MHEDDNDDLQSVIPEEEAPFVTVSEGLYREIFLIMRFQLSNDSVFTGNLELLTKILKNIVNEPTNKKFQKLRLSNERIKKAIGDKKGVVVSVDNIDLPWLPTSGSNSGSIVR